MIQRKINLLDGNLTIGRKYKIKKLTGNGRSKESYSGVEGILEEKYKNYYLFKDHRGFRECFLKVDFVIGEYRIEEVR